MSELNMDSIMDQFQKNIVLITLVVASVILRIFLSQREQENAKKVAAEVKPARLNNKIKLENEKVVDTLKCPDIETLEACKAGKVVMCRCWKSAKFPYCDGSHNAHNKETGDNVGPLIIETGK